jgi:peroxiredoxin
MSQEQGSPLQPGESAPEFTLPAVDRDGTVALANFRGKHPLLLVLMRGLQCPFCRRNIVRLGITRKKLETIGVETLAVVATTPERARLYLKYRPASVPLAADPDMATHRGYGVPCYPVTPDLTQQLRNVRVDPFNELPEPVPIIEANDVLDRLDGFELTETDRRDRARQFYDSLQLCAQYMVDRDGVVRWRYVEGETGGLEAAGRFPSDEEVLAAAWSFEPAATAVSPISTAPAGSRQPRRRWWGLFG